MICYDEQMKKFKTIDEFIKNLDHEKLQQVETLRTIILNIHPNLQEHIKWNAPSYVLDGEDRVTFNVMNKEGVVKLVLHMGVNKKEDKKSKPVLNDKFELIEWNSDIRGMLSFESLADIESKQDKVSQLIKDWLAIKP